MQTRGHAATALSATQYSLDRLGWVFSVALFPVAGIWFALAAPTGRTFAGLLASAVCLLVTLLMWLIGERAGVGWRAVRSAVPALAVVALAGIQVFSGARGDWLATEVAAISALLSAATDRSLIRSLFAAGVTLAATAAPEVLTASGEGHQRTAQLLSVYLLALIGIIVLRRAARRADRAGMQSGRILRTHLEAAATSGARAALQRVLHDTVLNTLESVANGIPPDRWPQLQRRCASDLRAVEDIADVGSSRELSDFIDEILASGVPVTTDVQWFADPPPIVREAVIASAGEAIRNAARHSGADVVELKARVSADALLVEVSDRGVGFEPAARDRLGVRTSITATMEAVDGYAVVDSYPGRGTTVSLVWDAVRARVSGVLLRLRRRLLLLLAVVSAVNLLGYLLVAMGVSTGTEQGVRVLTIAVAAAVIALLAIRGSRTPLGPWEFVGSLLGLAVIALLAPLADPLCTSAQSTAPVDLRSTVTLMIALAVVSVRQLVVMAAVVVGASGLAAALWLEIGSSCGWTYSMTSWVAVGFAVGAFVFARTLEGQRSHLATAAVEQEQELFAEAHRMGRLREMSRWNGIQVTQAVGLLQEIVAGEPDSARLRRRARDIAAQVRQWLLLIGTSGPVPLTITELLRHWPQAPTLLVDGDPRAVDDHGPMAQQMAGRLDDWIPRAPGGTVRITVSRTGNTASVLAHGDRPGACEDPDSWSDEDGWWLHLTWESSS